MSAPIVELTPENFDAEVVERSYELPVLVDFWAPWCGPCRALTPVLEQLVADKDGAFVLAKANTEDHPALGQRFAVRSIPAVKLFVDGKVVGEFMGALPATQVQRFLDTHLPSPSDELVTRARSVLAEDPARARELLRQATEDDPNHGPANYELARLALRNDEGELVEHHVSAIRPSADEWDRAQPLLAAVEFWEVCRPSGGEEALRARLEASPDDLDVRLALGCCLATQERWKDALETLLEVVKRNNRHQDAAARKAMVTIFDLIGRQHELSDHYVRQLQIYA